MSEKNKIMFEIAMKSELDQITKKYNKWEGVKFRTRGIIENQVERSL